jgi:signal peptidase II
LDAKKRKLPAGWWILPVTVPLLLALDQLTKYLVTSRLALYESWAPIPALSRLFTIHYITNTGAAFGILQNGNTFFVIVAIVVSVVLSIYYVTIPDGQRWFRLSLAMMMAGALGNMIDRLRVGHVIDFLNFQIWPVFNVADSSVVGGVLLLAVLLLLEERAERRQVQPAEETECA